MIAPLLVAAAGFAAGAMNAAAGGGSFVSVPVLISLGIPSVTANMSSTVALYPGNLASAWAYRRSLRSLPAVPVWPLFVITLTGGGIGAGLLLVSPSHTFDALIPWLLLVGALTFAVGPTVARRYRLHPRANTRWLLATQLLLGIYGGYFGGAVGIMMMAVWAVLGLTDIRAMNALKVVLVNGANTVAVTCFLVWGTIAWTETLMMMGAAVAGGYLGARLALRVKAAHLRLAIGVVNFAIVLVFFYKRYA